MALKIDFLGTKIGHLTVTGSTPAIPKYAGKLYWNCLCECGGTTVRSSNQLKEAKTSGIKLVCSSRCPYFLEEMAATRKRHHPTTPARVKKQTVSVPSTPMPTIEPNPSRASAGNVASDLTPKSAQLVKPLIRTKPTDQDSHMPGQTSNLGLTFESLHARDIGPGKWEVVPLIPSDAERYRGHGKSDW